MADFGVGAPIVVQAAGPAVVSPNPVIPIVTVPVPGPPGQSGSGGAVDTVTGAVVDNTDPANPVVNADPSGAAASAQADAQDYADSAINTAIGAEITRANSAYDVLGAAASAQAAAIAASQPVDSDLTAIAALTTTTFGRSLLTAADAAALRTAAALGTAATHPATDFDTAGAASTAQAAAIAAAASDATTKANAAQAASQPLDSDLTAIAALTTTSYGRAFLTLADAAAARTALGLGTLATQSGTFSGTSSGTNTGDQDLSSLAPKASPALTGSPTVNGSALSGANTGDETGATIRSKLGVTTLSGSNTGDQDLSGLLAKSTLQALSTGLVKVTTTTGVLSTAAAADVPTVAAGGTGPLSASDASTTNSRSPSGTAGGDLAGSYPNPTLAVDRIAKSIGTAKGDQIGFTGSGTPVRHAIGADGTVQTADSSQADGWKWAAPVAIPTNYLAPTGALYETLSRQFLGGGSQLTPGSGILRLYAIMLPAGLTIGHIAFVSSSTAAVTPTHQWFALYDGSRVQLATTADDLTTAWPASTIKTLAIATVASGAAASFTTTYTGVYYIGCMITAGTMPTLAGIASSFMNATAPALTAVSDTGQTTPPAFPHTAISSGVSSITPYAYVSA